VEAQKVALHDRNIIRPDLQQPKTRDKRAARNLWNKMLLHPNCNPPKVLDGRDLMEHP
jgi:hypothetical protein